MPSAYSSNRLDNLRTDEAALPEADNWGHPAEVFFGPLSIFLIDGTARVSIETIMNQRSAATFAVGDAAQRSVLTALPSALLGEGKLR